MTSRTLKRRRSSSSGSSSSTATVGSQQPSPEIAALPRKRKGRVGGSHEVGAPARLQSGHFVAWGTKADDVAAVQQMNDAVDQYNAENADKWYNSYDHVPDNDALPVGADDGDTMNWAVDNLEIADHWFMPTCLDDLVDNYYRIQAIDRWIEQWTREPLVLPRRCVLLCRGPPGIGKTSAIRLILHKHGFNNVVEINASDIRSKKLINQRLVPLLLNSSVNGARRTAIVLEEVDGLHTSGGGGSGGVHSSSSGHGGTSFSSSVGAHAVSSSGNSGGADTLVRFFQQRGYRPRGAVGGLMQPCKKCVRGPCTLCKKATALRRKSCNTCATHAKSCAPCKQKALKRHAVCRECAKMPCRRCKDQIVPGPVLSPPYTEKWENFRSTVPIIMLANNDYQPFMKALEDVSVYVPFFPVNKRCMERRIRDGLSRRFNIYWSQPRSHNGVPLWARLVEHTEGDMRKAIMLMTTAVRSAYARKRALPVDDAERDLSRLLIKRQDCEAFLGESRADVHDKSWSLWEGLNFLLRQCKTIEQAQRLAEQEMRSVPDWIFENYPKCAAVPHDAANPTHAAASVASLRLLSRVFSDAETVRSDFVYLYDRLAQQLYTHLGLVMPVMLMRRPNHFGVPDQPRGWVPTVSTAMVQIPVEIASGSGRRALQFQKSSLDGENGNAGLTLSRSIKERNCYADGYGLPYQVDVSQYYDYNNYVSMLSQTRTQRMMAFKDSEMFQTDHRRAPQVTKTKMTPAQRDAARQRQRAATATARQKKTGSAAIPPPTKKSKASKPTKKSATQTSALQRLDKWIKPVTAGSPSSSVTPTNRAPLPPMRCRAATKKSDGSVPAPKRTKTAAAARVRRKNVIESDSDDESSSLLLSVPVRRAIARRKKK